MKPISALTVLLGCFILLVSVLFTPGYSPNEFPLPISRVKELNTVIFKTVEIMKIEDLRVRFPEYDEIGDRDLAWGIYKAYIRGASDPALSSISYREFSKKFGVSPPVGNIREDLETAVYVSLLIEGDDNLRSLYSRHGIIKGISIPFKYPYMLGWGLIFLGMFSSLGSALLS